jgi:ethanolamine permease
MISLFKLRATNPSLERPFKAPFYPVFPIIALVISSLCLIAIVYYNLMLSALFLLGLVVTWIIYRMAGTEKDRMEQDEILRGDGKSSVEVKDQ